MFSLIGRRLINSVRCSPALLTHIVPPQLNIREKNEFNQTEESKNFKSSGLEIIYTEDLCTVKVPFGKYSHHEVSAEFEDNTLVIKGKAVDHNEQNDHKIKQYTHKIKLENNYNTHAIEAKTEDCNFIVTIPIEGKSETTKP